MKHLIALALLVAPAAQDSLPTCSGAPGFAAAQALGDKVVQCVLTNARRFESSGERADLVAAAAVSRCSQQLARYRHALTPLCGLGVARRTDQILQRRVIDMAIAEIIELRTR